MLGNYMKNILKDGRSYPERSYPSYRTQNQHTPDDWIVGKIADDGAEGLWRIHDRLYDFSNFQDQHPGGKSWLKMTKGTDITEAFESHHLSTLPESMLEKFYIKDASVPRYSPYTFKEDGFYRTLKARVRKELKSLPVKELQKRSQVIIEGLAFSMVVFSVGVCCFESIVVKVFFSLMASLFMTWTINCAHNFLHKKDNWRMYFASLGFLPIREWRVIHVLSHHLYTNTLIDLEMSLIEPFIVWMPRKSKGFFMKYMPRLYAIFIYVVIHDTQLLRRIVDSWRFKVISRFELDDLVPFLLPIAMYIFGKSDLKEVLIVWIIIWHLSSILIGIINLHAAHHHPEIFHDGDIARDDKDWGLFQMDAVADRVEINSYFFMVLTHFGEHTLHHLFPTLDHSVLKKLHPVFAKTCEEFKTKLRLTNQMEMFIGYYQQIARTEPKNFNIECNDNVF